MMNFNLFQFYQGTSNLYSSGFLLLAFHADAKIIVFATFIKKNLSAGFQGRIAVHIFFGFDPWKIIKGREHGYIIEYVRDATIGGLI